MRSLTIIFLIFLLVSCSKTKPEEVNEAIDVAQTYLSESECQKAINLLEDVGRQNEDAIYLQVLASAYACKADFREVNFISNDLEDIDSGSVTDLMKSLTLLSLSNETEADSTEYVSILTAMEVLLESNGATQPSHTSRVSTYGSRKAGDMGIQNLLLSIVQLGKFLNYYGNVDNSGTKGAGVDGTNSCFLNYSYVSAQTVISALPGSNNCSSNNSGHSDLDLTTTAGKRRACEGLMLFTNLVDVLTNIDLSGDDTFGSLTAVSTLASNLKTAVVSVSPALATLMDTTSQSVCEDTLASASEVNNMQLIYALLFETGLE